MVTPPPPPSAPPPPSSPLPPSSGDDPGGRRAEPAGPTGSVGPGTAGESADPGGRRAEPAAPTGSVRPGTADDSTDPAAHSGPTGSVRPGIAGESADPAEPAGGVDPADGPGADAVPPGDPAADDRTVGLGLTPAPGGTPTPGSTGTPRTGTPGRPSPRVVRERRAVVEVDALAVGRGALPALAVAAGAALVARLLDAVADDGAPLALPLLLTALAGLIGGGWEAARTCARLPLTHAALAALVGIGVLLGVNVGWQLIDGQDVRWAYVGVWALLALACGVVGGLLALRAPRRRADSVP